MATSGEEQGGEGLDLVAEGKATAVRRKALGWSRGDVAGRAALDPRIIQLLEMGLWSEGEAIGRVRAVLLRAEGGDLEVQLPPVEIQRPAEG